MGDLYCFSVVAKRAGDCSRAWRVSGRAPAHAVVWRCQSATMAYWQA